MACDVWSEPTFYSFHIGTLEKQDVAPAEAAPESSVIEDTFLHKTKWKKGKLESVEVVSHDSRLYHFALEKEDQMLGLVRCRGGPVWGCVTHALRKSQPCGQHVFIRLRRKGKKAAANEDGALEGELVQRAYTPVSPADARGKIALLIKLYLAGTNSPVGGKMTTWVDGRCL